MRFLGLSFVFTALSALACSQSPTSRPPNGTAPSPTDTAPVASTGTGGAPSVLPTTPPTVTNPLPMPTSSSTSTVMAIVRKPFSAPSCDPVTSTPYPRRLARLTPEQYGNTISDLVSGRRAGNDPLRPTCPGEFNFADQGPTCLPQNVSVPLQDATKGIYRYSTTAGTTSVNDYEFRLGMSSTETTSKALVVAIKSGTCWATDSAGAGFEACVDTLVKDKGSLLFRRPLDEAEVAKYAGMAKTNAAMLGKEEALALAFQAMLIAPQFVFQPEIGVDVAVTPGVSKLTPYELASSLAYTLTSHPPDAELWAAAATGALTAPDQIKAQVVRMLATPAGKGARNFVMEYFDLRHLLDVRKAGDKFSGCEYQKMRVVNEAQKVVDDLWSTNSTTGFLKSLLTSNIEYSDCATAAVYGAMGITATADPDPPTPQKILAPATERSGFLTHPAFLAGYGNLDDTLAVRRGRFVNERLLCRDVPPIPLGSVPMIPPAENRTMRERLVLHSTSPGCAACHSLMDPIGLALEVYDTYGAYRTTMAESNKPIDATGSISGAGDADGAFNGGVEMSQLFSNSKTVETCFLRNGFRYMLGRQEDEYDQCSVANAQKAYVDGGGSFVDYITALYTSDSFLNRSF